MRPLQGLGGGALQGLGDFYIVSLLHYFKTGEFEEQLFDADILELHGGFLVLSGSFSAYHRTSAEALMLDDCSG